MAERVEEVGLREAAVALQTGRPLGRVGDGRRRRERSGRRRGLLVLQQEATPAVGGGRGRRAGDPAATRLAESGHAGGCWRGYGMLTCVAARGARRVAGGPADGSARCARAVRQTVAAPPTRLPAARVLSGVRHLHRLTPQSSRTFINKYKHLILSLILYRKFLCSIQQARAVK